MNIKTHRNPFPAFGIIAAFILFMVVSCNEDNTPYPPTISLLATTGAITHDTSATMGDTLHFHVKAVKGGDKLLYFFVKINGQTIKDSTFSSEGFELHMNIVKGADTLEDIQFIIRDRDSQQASVGVKVTLEGGAAWGPVTRLEDIELGAQDNINTGGFYSIADSTVHTLADAFQHQELIDLLYYYEAGDENTIASPGANLSASLFTGPYALSNWTTLRTTRFKKITISLSDFQSCPNDSLLIESYGVGDGNRKAKNLAAGQLYSFMTEDSRAGIFYVKSVTGAETGSIVIDIVVQKK